MTRNQASLAAALLFAAACGGDPSVPVQRPPAATAAVALSGAYELRLLGVNPASFSAVRLRIRSIEVRAGNVLLTQAVRRRDVDLANTGQAWLLGVFGVPAGAEELEATVTLREGGSFADDTRKGNIDAACTAIRVKLLVSQLKLRNHGVIKLDLARSLVPAGASEDLLVPQLAVQY